MFSSWWDKNWGGGEKFPKIPPEKKYLEGKKVIPIEKGYLTKEDIRLKAKKPPLLKMLK